LEDRIGKIARARKRRKSRRESRRERRQIRAYRWLNRLLKLTLGKYLTIRYNLKAYNLTVFENLKPPYIMMANHSCFWDPFIISNFVPDPIYFVVTDASFRSPFMRFLLGLVGSIPKTKAISDFGTVKQIMEIKRRGGVIGIFPEGHNTWDGHSLPVIYATAKLIKHLKIPVVIPEKRGAFLSIPRWAKKNRRGRITLDFKLAFTGEEIERLSTDEIYTRLSGFLDYNEYEFQRKEMIPYKGKDLAEYLELVLFICPECKSIGSMYSLGRVFTCKKCNYITFYNNYGFFENSNKEVAFETIRDWNVWQLNYLKTFLQEKKRQNCLETIIEDSRIDCRIGYRDEPMVKSGKGTLQLYTDGIVFSASGGDLSFSIDEITGLNVQNEEKLEFYHKDNLFRFDSKDRRVSIYKWYCCLKLLQEMERG